MQKSIVIPNLSVDCVIFGYNESTLNVLLRQEHIEYRGKTYLEWKLPGNHIRMDEKIENTASRILKEQTGAEDIFLKQFMVFSDLDRLRRRQIDYQWIRKNGLKEPRVLTIGFYSLVKITDVDKTKLYDVAKWHNVYEIKELIFDHKQIIEEALKRLRIDLLESPLIFELLPQKFTLTQMQTLYELILNTTFDKRNFRRKISNIHYLINTQEKQKGVMHKPALLYKFDAMLYEKNRKENLDFYV